MSRSRFTFSLLILGALTAEAQRPAPLELRRLSTAVVIDGRDVGDALAGFLVGGSVPFLMAVISRGGVGGGDIKLLAMLGPALGWKGVLGVFLASQFVALFVVIAVSVARRRLSRDPVPVGAIIAGLAALLLASGPLS